MPIDDHGRWFERRDHPSFNDLNVLPPLVPRGLHGLADAERALWEDERRRRVPPAQEPVAHGLNEQPQFARAGEVGDWFERVAAAGEAARAGARRAAPIQRDRDGEMAANTAWMKKYPHMDVAAMKTAEGMYDRGVNLGKFKVEYDSHEQIHQKLNGTVILVKGHPFTVSGTIAAGEGRYGLLLSDREGTLSWVWYSEIDDFRSLAPGYVNYSSTAYWVYRIPDRQNHQGMTARNMFMKSAGPNGRPSGMHNNTMLACLQSRKNIPFQPNLIPLIENGVINSVRLSNNLALHKVKNKGAVCGVEYIGRPLGLVIEGRLKVLDDADLGPTWIHKDCADVNLELF